MKIVDFEFEKAGVAISRYVEKRRPPVEVRNQVDLFYRVDRQSYILYEVRPVWDNPSEKQEILIAKITFVKSSKSWKLFCKQGDMKWHRHPLCNNPKDVNPLLDIIERDEFYIFWG